MKIVEILEIEKTNTDCVNLFKEGICWKAYEKSAWRFIKNIKEYRVFRKYVQEVKQDIIYLAFPDSALSEIKSSVETKYASSHITHKNNIFIELKGFYDTVGFEEWKAEIELKSNKEKSKVLELKIEELTKLIQQMELRKDIRELRMERQFDKLQKTLLVNSDAINAINLYLTNKHKSNVKSIINNQ